MLRKYPRRSSSPRTRGSTQGTTATGFKRKPNRWNQPIRDCTLRHESDPLTPTRASTHGEYVAGAGSAEPPPKPRGSTRSGDQPGAGINPERGSSSIGWRAIPPASGNQPHNSVDYAHAPHTRESTIFRQDNQTTGRQPPCPHAGINHSHQSNPPRGRHIPPHTRGSTLPTLPARHRQPIPPHTRGSAVYLKETPASLTHSPSHAGIRPSHNPRRNPARHVPPHTREPIPRTRLSAP